MGCEKVSLFSIDGCRVVLCCDSYIRSYPFAGAI